MKENFIHNQKNLEKKKENFLTHTTNLKKEKNGKVPIDTIKETTIPYISYKKQ